MRNSLVLLAASALLAACGYESKYEEMVYDYEPVYCYQSIGAVQCHQTPKHRDQARLVNYYGPAPGRYDKPAPPRRTKPMPPPEIDYFVKDPEPVPQPTPAKARAEALPWLKAKEQEATGVAYTANARLETGEVGALDLGFKSQEIALPPVPAGTEEEEPD